jgi:hypothetical protein
MAKSDIDQALENFLEAFEGITETVTTVFNNLNEATEAATECFSELMWLLDTYELWSEEGTYTFPNGNTYYKTTKET